MFIWRWSGGLLDGKVDSSAKMQWNRTYGGTESDIALSVIGTSDGGYVVVGYTGSFGAGGDDFCLIKTDNTGNMEWNRTIGGAENDYAFSFVETSYVGYTYSVGTGNSDAWLIKTDEQGVIPEFPAWIILPLFLFITLCAVATKKKTLHQLANTRK